MNFDEKLDEKIKGRREKREKRNLLFDITIAIVSIILLIWLLPRIIMILAGTLRGIVMGGGYVVAAAGILIALIAIITYITKQRKLNKLKKDMEIK